MSMIIIIQLAVLLALMFAAWAVIATSRYRNEKYVGGKVLATIITSSRDVISDFVPYDGDAVWIRIEGGRIVATTPPTKLGNKKLLEKGLGETTGSGLYFFNRDSIVYRWWPRERGIMARLTSVKVPQVIWIEGHSEPLTNPKLYEMMREAQEVAMQHQGLQIPGMIATPKLITAYADQGTLLTAAAMEEQYRELQQSFVSITSRWINPMIVYIALFLALGGLVGAIVMLVMTNSKLEHLIKGLGI